MLLTPTTLHPPHTTTDQSSGDPSLTGGNNSHNKSGGNWASQPHFKVEPKSYQIVQVYEAEGTLTNCVVVQLCSVYRVWIILNEPNFNSSASTSSGCIRRFTTYHSLSHSHISYFSHYRSRGNRPKQPPAAAPQLCWPQCRGQRQCQYYEKHRSREPFEQTQVQYKRISVLYVCIYVCFWMCMCWCMFVDVMNGRERSMRSVVISSV